MPYKGLVLQILAFSRTLPDEYHIRAAVTYAEHHAGMLSTKAALTALQAGRFQLSLSHFHAILHQQTKLTSISQAAYKNKLSILTRKSP